MKLKYVGEEGLVQKYKGRMIPLKKNVTVIDFDEKDAKEFSKKKINGDLQWVEAKAPAEKQKGVK